MVSGDTRLTSGSGFLPSRLMSTRAARMCCPCHPPMRLCWRASAVVVVSPHNPRSSAVAQGVPRNTPWLGPFSLRVCTG